MRTLTESIKSEITKTRGVETHIIVGVQWTDGGEVFYSSHDVSGALKSVVSITDLDITQSIEGSGSSQNVTVTLSDTTGDLTSVLDSIDIHKRPAKIYLSFEGIPLDQSLVLIDGEINSDMSWNDSARTLTFSILSKIEGRLFGFAVEDGLFQKVDEAQRTTPWPFRFGDTCDYPAVQIQNGVKGFLRIGQGVVDPTLDAQICQAQQINCPNLPPANQLSDVQTEDGDTDNQAYAVRTANNQIQSDGFSFSTNTAFGRTTQYGYFTVSTACGEQSNALSNTFEPQLGGGTPGVTCLQNNNDPVPDLACQRAKFTKLCQLLRDRANQLVYVNPTLLIANGEEFPQGREVTIRVGDVIYDGVFAGEVFTINGETRQDAPENPDCSTVPPVALGYRKVEEKEPSTLAECNTATSLGFELKVVGGAGEALRLLDEFESGEFKWLPAGTTVTLEEVSTKVHVVSMVPGIVTSVSAYRTFGDIRLLAEVPTDYYVVVDTDYGDLTVSEIWLDRELSAYRDENWDDTVYASYDSSVTNPADVIQWIVERYTDFTVDAASFAAVKTLLTKYPCNFYHASKTNVIDVMNKIAYEARCALSITDNVVKITYLSKEPDSIRTLTTADIVANTFQIDHTRTEDLATSSQVEWRPVGAPAVSTDVAERSFTVEHNVQKYGYFGQQSVYDTINNEPQALKTATFWSIRTSNTWRLVKFSTTIEHSDLEVFDCVTLDIAPFPTGKVVITSSSFNVSNRTIDFEAWTPILSGTTSEYIWAWPAAQPSAIPYPDNNFDIPAPAISITPPSFHPLFVDTQGNQPVAVTAGDRFPSDIDDTLWVTDCDTNIDPLIIDTIEPQFNRIDFIDLQSAAVSADNTSAANANGGGGGGSADTPKETRACGSVTFAPGCLYEVLIQYSIATTIAPAIGEGFDDCDVQPGACNISATGARCGGGSFFWCRTFGSASMATSFAQMIASQIDMNYCSWTVGQQGPVDVIGPTKVKADSAGGECEDVGDVETHAPTPLF